MAAFNLFVAISGALFIFFILGIHNYLTAHEENSCEMTYMYEYPQYVRISLPDNETEEFPKYALYAYGEGQYTEQLRSMRFSGIPVLFVPGNSGSYRQVRSLASVALRKARDSRSPFHFNFFAADLNEEHSALFGGVLPEQTRFISKCIKAILKLYKYSKFPPSSVLLFGHSMGGMVAKGVFLEPDFVPGSVHTVLTLATPHASSVIALDSYVANYYSRVNEYWSQGSDDRLLISVGGGHRDLLVRSGLTLQGNISTLSTAVPAVWVSADHQCILWCKQLVLSLARALFDSVDLRSKQLALDTAPRQRAFSYHLLHRNFGKRATATMYPKDAYFDRDGEWREFLRRQFSVMEPRLGRQVFVMIRLMANDPKHEMLAIEAVGLESRDWVFACIADLVYKDVRMCEKGVNLSNMTQFVPSLRSRRKVVHLNLHALKRLGFTHVIARLPAASTNVQLNVDVYSKAERVISVSTLPQWYTRSVQVVLPSTLPGSLNYRLEFPSMDRAWHAANVRMETTCGHPLHHAVATLATDWSKEDSHAFLTENVSQMMPLKLHLLKPSWASKTETAHLTLHLDPVCSYTVKIESSLPMVLGQLVRFYAPQLPAYMVAVLLLALRAQLSGTAEGSPCIAFHSALASGARPYTLLPLVKIVASVLKWGPIAKALPVTDWLLLQSQGLDMFLLPMLLYCVASFAAYVLGLAIWVAVVVWGTTANKILIRFISRSIFGGFQWSEWILSAFARVPCVVACLLVTLAYATCGALALAAGLCFYFLLVVKMYEEYLEELLKVPLRLITGRPTELWARSEKHLSELHFHCTGLLLWAVTAGLNAPCALAWARAYSFSTRLSPDPSLGPALALCLCAPVLWQRHMPRPYLKHSKELGAVLYVLAAICLIFAPVSLYRLGPFLVTAFMLICLQQLLVLSVVPSSPHTSATLQGSNEGQDKLPEPPVEPEPVSSVDDKLKQS